MKLPVISTVISDGTLNVSNLIESIDFPTENFFIVNGFESLEHELNSIASTKHPFIDKITVSNLPGFIGVPASWNLTIKCFLQSPFWVFASDYVSFKPSFLESIVNTATADPNIGIIHGSPGSFGVGSWDVFLIRDGIIKIMGLFDENSSPEGCEGADYFFRTVHRPLKKVLDPGSGYILCKDPGVSSFEEIDYLKNKWGDWRVQDVNKSPFGNEALPISCFFYDIKKHRSTFL